jgi:FdhE protein
MVAGTPSEALELLDRRVSALRRAHPEAEEPLSLQSLLIRTALGAARAPEAPPFPLPREQVVARVRSGVPMLHDQPVRLDIHFAADLFSRLVNALRDRDDAELQAGLDGIVAASTAGRIDPERLFSEAFVQHHSHLTDLAIQVEVEPELLATLAGQSVAPILRAYAERLMPLVERATDGDWTVGYCPVCGGWPLVGELRGIELARWLRCAGCGSGWRSQRLLCPYCANTDYHSLGTLTIEAEQRFRIAVCERCHSYLKVCNAFDPAPAALLPLEDVISLHLDVAAIERGYHRPVGSGYPIELAAPGDDWLDELA